VAEERSTMNTPPVAPAVGATPDGSGADDTEEIRQQIERTRESMGQTIDELQERLSPQHVMQQARDTVHDATVGRVKDMVASAGEAAGDVAERVQESAGSLVEEVRQHPVVSAVVGAGVAWLLTRGASMFERRDIYDEAYDVDEYDAHDEVDMWDENAGPPRWGDESPASYLTANYGSMPSARSASDRTAVHQGERRMGNGHTHRGWTSIFRDHPIPTSLAAASIGYLLMQRGDSSTRSRDEWARRPYGRPRYAGAVGRDELYDRYGSSTGRAAESSFRSAEDSARRTAEGARQKMNEAAEKVGEFGEQVGDSVRRAGEQVRETASDLTENVQESWQYARRRTVSEFDEWMDENPLAVGAAALAVGVAIGFSTPRTRVEDRTMGSARDSLVEKTTEYAEEAAQEVQERVQSAAQSVADAVTGDGDERDKGVSDATWSSSPSQGSKDSASTQTNQSHKPASFS
jgi:ElaB/YqjD/DUF883 family membrane-anchored ribosome-binding protein